MRSTLIGHIIMKKILALIVLMVTVVTSSFACTGVNPCGYCGGRGRIVGVYTSVMCSNCNGTGKIYVQTSNTQGRSVNGYIISGNQSVYFGTVTYFGNGVAYVKNYENQPLRVYQSPIRAFAYYVILTLPNYQTVTIYFNR